MNVRVYLPVIMDYCRIDISKHYYYGKQRKNDNVYLFAEEYPEHGVPVGIPRSGYFFGVHRTVVHRGKQLFLRHSKLLKIYFLLHYAHLAFSEKEILGSTIAISISPRISDSTLSTE